MRIVASACLVLAILFMVGCGTSAEDKAAIKKHGEDITKVEKKAGDVEKMAQDLAKKIDVIEKYLTANPIGKAKFPPEEVKPPVPPPPTGKVEAKKEEPKKEEPKKEPAKAKETGKTK